MNERIEELIEELDALAVEYKRNEVLRLQSKAKYNFGRYATISFRVSAAPCAFTTSRSGRAAITTLCASSIRP